MNIANNNDNKVNEVKENTVKKSTEKIGTVNKKIKNTVTTVQDRAEKINRFQQQFDTMDKQVNEEIDEKVNKINVEKK